MKKYLLSALLLCTSGSVMAGSAIIPYWQIDSDAYSCYRISNTSAVDATVNVKLFRADGTLHPGGLHGNQIINSLNTPFTLQPQKTAQFCVETTGPFHLGYGVID